MCNQEAVYGVNRIHENASRSISRVLLSIAIHLGIALLQHSSDLPERQCGNTLYAFPIWSCIGQGLPCHFYH